MSDDATAAAAFAYELGVLKRIRRAGWWHAGVRDPESVAEHSLRVAQLAAIIAVEEGEELAASRADAAISSLCNSDVLLEGKNTNPRVAGGKLTGKREGVITGGVVDDDQLPVGVGLSENGLNRFAE